MSKGKGQKIAIKFDKALLGDVSGNESAFTVTGQQKNPLGTGTPELTEYTVDSVERYPVATLYEDDFSGTLDGVEVGVNGLVLESVEVPSGETEDTYDTATLSGSSYTSIANRIEIKVAGTLAKVKTKTKTAGNYTLFIKSDNGTTTYQTHTINDAIADSWITFVISPLAVAIGDKFRMEITRPTGTAYMASGLYDGTLWKTTKGIFGGTEFDFTNAMGFIFQDTTEEYTSPGTYTTSTPADTLPTNPRLKWTEDLPAGTSITAEYAVNQDGLTTPETWTPINNSDLLTIPDPATGYFLWLKYTLATTDTAVTPTLLSVWLEEAEAPPDTILLSFDTYNRFNDVEGDITVAYNQSLGTLAGTRPVESFSVDFTPTDLEPTPIDEHTITAGIDLTVDLIDLEFTEIYADHNVTHTATAGIDVTVALINIEDINP